MPGPTPSVVSGSPDDDRVLRGARDGFVETLVFNTALIRRRIRDPRLTMEIHQVGSVSKSDVVLCYLEGEADPKLVRRLRDKLSHVDVKTLTMGQGKSGGEPGAPPMVESLPQGAVNGAARLRGGQCGGGKGTAAGGQFAFGHDPAYRPVRFCSGYQRLLFSPPSGNVSAVREGCGFLSHCFFNSSMVSVGAEPGLDSLLAGHAPHQGAQHDSLAGSAAGY